MSVRDARRARRRGRVRERPASRQQAFGDDAIRAVASAQTGPGCTGRAAVSAKPRRTGPDETAVRNAASDLVPLAKHLDLPTADALTADLLTATESRTTLLVTHRLTGLDAVDEILVLDEGRITDRGTHTDLIARPGLYQSLWHREHLVPATPL